MPGALRRGSFKFVRWRSVCAMFYSSLLTACSNIDCKINATFASHCLAAVLSARPGNVRRFKTKDDDEHVNFLTIRRQCSDTADVLPY